MKTKTNKVPLVGPRGRRELLDRIDELEKKIAELASNQPETHVLEILSFSESDESIEDTLARMKLDGRDIGIEDFNELGVFNTYILFNGVEYAITEYSHNDSGIIYICAGYASVVRDAETTLTIQIMEDASYIAYSEL